MSPRINVLLVEDSCFFRGAATSVLQRYGFTVFGAGGGEQAIQYFDHCTPHGLTEEQITLDQVAQVLQPVLKTIPTQSPAWAEGLDDKLRQLEECNSLADLQGSGALVDVRQRKLDAGDQRAGGRATVDGSSITRTRRRSASSSANRWVSRAGGSRSGRCGCCVGQGISNYATSQTSRLLLGLLHK